MVIWWLEEQLHSLQNIYPAKSALYQVNGYQNDGAYYDPSRSHEWNTNSPGLAYRQFTSNWSNDPARGGDIVSAILSESDDVLNWGQGYLMRVCTVYWKTQRKVGHLTRITERWRNHSRNFTVTVSMYEIYGWQVIWFIKWPLRT